MSSNSVAIFDNQKNYNALCIILNILAIVFLILGVLLPITIISNIDSRLLNNSPEFLVSPIYLGILLITLSGLSYLISVILSNPSEKTVWIENIVSVLGVILVILGVIGFIVAVSKTNGSFRDLQNYGIIGGIFIFLFHACLGLICLGTAGLHDKYRIENFDKKAEFGDENDVYCENCGEKVSDSTSSFCESCGIHLSQNTQQKKEHLSAAIDETNIVFTANEQEVLNSFMGFGINQGEKLVMEKKSRKIDRFDKNQWKNIERKGEENKWVILFEK